MKQSRLLELFRQSSVATSRIEDEHVRVCIPHKTWGVCKDDRFSEKRQREDSIIEGVTSSITLTRPLRGTYGRQNEYVFRCDFFELKELIDIKPESGSSYIRSVCEPFDLEIESDLKKVEDWLTHFGLYPYTQVHAAGHLNYDEIRDVNQTVAESADSGAYPTS